MLTNFPNYHFEIWKYLHIMVYYIKFVCLFVYYEEEISQKFIVYFLQRNLLSPPLSKTKTALKHCFVFITFTHTQLKSKSESNTIVTLQMVLDYKL